MKEKSTMTAEIVDQACIDIGPGRIPYIRLIFIKRLKNLAITISPFSGEASASRDYDIKRLKGRVIGEMEVPINLITAALSYAKARKKFEKQMRRMKLEKLIR